MDTILVADDDAALRGLLRLVGTRAGFEVDTASNGREALEKIARNDYLVVIVDLMMPGMNGYEVVEGVGQLQKRPAVMVVTALPDASLAPLDGTIVHSIIRKPFDIDMVADVLSELARELKEGKDSAASGAETAEGLNPAS